MDDKITIVDKKERKGMSEASIEIGRRLHPQAIVRYSFEKVMLEAIHDIRTLKREEQIEALSQLTDFVKFWGILDYHKRAEELVIAEHLKELRNKENVR